MLFANSPSYVIGGILAVLYGFGVLVACVVAWLFVFMGGSRSDSGFIIELPEYRLPGWRMIVRTSVSACWHFVRRAGLIIVPSSILLWAALEYPRLSQDHRAAIMANSAANVPIEQMDNLLAAAQIRESCAGQFGRLIEPAISPLGYDWTIGVGLVGAFAAREVFVSTMSIVHGQGGDDSEAGFAALRQRMRHPDHGHWHHNLLAVSLLVWFALAMQCASTVAVMVRETKGWRWPLVQLVFMNALAYVVCLAIWQIGSCWP